MISTILCVLLSISIHVTSSKSPVFYRSIRNLMVYEKNEGIEKRRFVAAAAPRDLQVEAVVLNYPQRLGLSISWERGVGPRAAESFTVIVRPVNVTDLVENEEEQDSYCGTFSYHHDISAGRNTWLISREEHNDDAFINVQPECSYTIELYGNPYDGKSSAKLLYTVPRCVGEICSCRLSKLILPKARMFPPVPLASGAFNISWVVEENNIEGVDLHDARFIVSAGPEFFRPFDNRATMYNLVRVADMDWKSRDVVYSTIFMPRENKSHQAIVELKDRWNCYGESSMQIFEVPAQKVIKNEDTLHTEADKPQAPFDNTVLLSIIVPCAALTLVLLGGLFTLLLRNHHNCSFIAWLRRKTHMGTLQPVTSWRSVYRAVNNVRENGRYSESPAAEERNVLYFEQEIQEALERGDADCYEVNYNRIHLGKQIGRGAFGRVFLARIDSVAGNAINQTIAVKKLKHRASPDELDDFLAEIATLKRVGKHPNVVALIGCCTITQPYCMLMEWVPCGDLLGYLRKLRAQIKKRNNFYIDVLPDNPGEQSSSYVDPMPVKPTSNLHSHRELIPSESTQLSSLPTAPSSSADESCSNPNGNKSESTGSCDLDPRELHSFALQIAQGMAHLEQKQITHRDLAARNVLIDTSRTLKISDFGLSRSGIYVNTKRRKVPLRWLSIEAMRDNLYSSRSDVWAYGVLLWEIGTLGGFPYPTVADYDLLSFVQQGKRLEKPHNCTDELYTLMTKCWNQEADERPSFEAICSMLKSTYGRKNVYVDFATLQATVVPLPPTEQIPNKKEQK